MKQKRYRSSTGRSKARMPGRSHARMRNNVSNKTFLGCFTADRQARDQVARLSCFADSVASDAEDAAQNSERLVSVLLEGGAK